MVLISVLAGVAVGLLTAAVLYGLLSWVDMLVEMERQDWNE